MTFHMENSSHTFITSVQTLSGEMHDLGNL